MADDATVKITNRSGTPVCVLLAVGSAKNASDGTPEFGYLQQLSLLDLGNGATTLADNATATVTLPPSTDSPNGLQELLISKPASLYPVQAVLLTKDQQASSYPDVTVTKASARSIDIALNFCRNVMAAPTSNLAIAFNAALQAAYDEDDPLTMVDDIDKFFAGQPPFASLKFVDWVAVSSWLQAFAFLWGMDDGGTPGRKYWIYPAPFFTTADNASLGAIEFQAPSPGYVGDPKDHDSGFTITLTRTNGASAKLHYSQRILGDDAKSLTVSGSFVAATWLTGDPNGPGLVPLLVGKLDGKQVVAVSVAPPDKPSESDGGRNVHDLVNDYIGYIGLGASLLAFGLFGYEIYKWFKARGADPNRRATPEERRAARLAGEEAARQVKEALQRDLDGISDGLNTIPDFTTDIVNRMRDQVVRTLAEVTRRQAQRAINELKAQLDELATIENTEALQEAIGDLAEAQRQLGGDVADLKEAIAAVREVAEAIPRVVAEMGEAVNQATKETIEEALSSAEESAKLADQADDSSDEVEDGEEKVKEDAVPVEL
jgi:hypothetical protein